MLQVTSQQIEDIDRLGNQLVSRLSYKHYEPHYYDGCGQEHDAPNPSLNHATGTIPLHEVNISIEVKTDEDKEFYAQDSIKSEANTPENRDENPIPDTCDDNAFSSDDDRPIIQQKEALTKKSNNKQITRQQKEALAKKAKAKSKAVAVKKKKRAVLNKEPKTDRRKKVLGDDLDAAIFASYHLDAEEQIDEFQKRMLSANYKNSVHKCDACYKGFLDADAYSNHMVRHTDVSI